MTKARGRTRYVFRLDITYPAGSRLAGWEPDWWRRPPEPPDREAFRWPRNRLFLTRENAMRRAAWLRGCGALVNVVRSQPVVWPDDTPAEVRRPQHEPSEPLAGLEAL